MPFRSEAQRRFLWMKHPEIAQKWASEYGSEIHPSPRHKVARALAEKRRRGK